MPETNSFKIEKQGNRVILIIEDDKHRFIAYKLYRDQAAEFIASIHDAIRNNTGCNKEGEA